MNHKTTRIRTYQLTVNVTGFMEGGIDDWPANIQDVILAELERLAAQVRLPLKIINSFCDKDIDTGVFFIHVVASEVVVADERAVQREQAMLLQALASHVGTKH